MKSIKQIPKRLEAGGKLSTLFPLGRLEESAISENKSLYPAVRVNKIFLIVTPRYSNHFPWNSFV